MGRRGRGGWAPSLLLCVAVLGGEGACVRAPEIVMVDRATALEQQAGGSFPELERKLDQGGVAPVPVPLTPAQLRSLGIKPAPLVGNAELTEADRVDRLLHQHCVGEGRDALLAVTHDACQGAVDKEATAQLAERVNHARLQLFDWMHVVQPHAKVEELRQRWQTVHARGVVCGGWVQGPDGTWGEKAC